MIHAVLDSNVYIDWWNAGAREELVTGPALIRHLSAPVAMELRLGARTAAARRAFQQLLRMHELGKRVLVPDLRQFVEAGRVLQVLKTRGHEIRSSSLVNDVMIALSARSIGATLFSRNAHDFEAIRDVVAFSLEVVADE